MFKRKNIVLLVVFFCLIVTVYFVLFSNTLLHYFFHKKIWIHRVNSIEKLREVQDDFYGVELDVVFLDSLDQFDVTHPPEPSIGLNLSEYLISCRGIQLFFWLDFKNLDKSNTEKSLDRLNNICNKLNIDKDKIIIESTNANHLNTFKKSGYKTSYYMPWPGLYRIEGDSLIQNINLVKENIGNNELTYISSNYHDYEIMNSFFPKEKKIIWLTGLEKEYSNSLLERLFLYKILMDKKVEVLLVEYKSKSINR